MDHMIISHRYRFIFVKTTKVGGTSLELLLDKLCGDEDVLTPHWTPEPGYRPRNHCGVFNPIPEITERRRHAASWRDLCVAKTFRELVTRERFYEPMPAWQIRCRVPARVWNSYFKFTIERNPWDKAVSRYFHSKAVYEPKYKRALTIDAWLDYLEARLMTPWVCKAWGSEAPYNFPRYADPWTGEVLVDQICRYESLNSELEGVFRRLGLAWPGEVPRKAKAHFRSDRRHYSEVLSKSQQERIAKVCDSEIKLLGYRFEQDVQHQ
jgi:hypothetical protein